MGKKLDKIKEKKGLWTEFKEFAIKGNAMALAVGTIIGAAFSTITKSLTDDIIMPIISMFLGGVDFSELKIALPRMPWVDPVYEAVLDEAGEVVLDAAGNPKMQEVVNYLSWGNFLSAVINFFILAFVVFMLVKTLNKLADMGKKKEPEKPAEPEAPPAPSNEEVLLGEIRDLLKNKK